MTSFRAIVLHTTLILVLVRALAPAPEASDPLHAFYERWLSLPFWLIMAPAAVVFVLDVATAFWSGWRRGGDG